MKKSEQVKSAGRISHKKSALFKKSVCIILHDPVYLKFYFSICTKYRYLILRTQIAHTQIGARLVIVRVGEGHGREKQSQSSSEYRSGLPINFPVALAFIVYAGGQYRQREGVFSSGA